ncbi:hypothetical protein [Flavobacterium sp.]|uniref:hypothetical protein n=1 Tax=Flavobacterium sp. TaxID=239 RepID=UPI0028BE5F2F|nr:hypothetical protein [Flavobacterium sp.]
MGLFNKKEKKIIAEINQKSKVYHADFEKEINDLLDDLKHDYQENKIQLDDFSEFIKQMESKLSHTEIEKLNNYFAQASKMKSCAKKSIEGLNYLSREQKKMSKDAQREFEQFLS